MIFFTFVVYLYNVCFQYPLRLASNIHDTLYETWPRFIRVSPLRIYVCMYTCTIFHGRERAQSTWIIHEVGAGLHLLINRQPVVTWAFSLSSQIRRRKSFWRLSLFLKEFDSTAFREYYSNLNELTLLKSISCWKW